MTRISPLLGQTTGHRLEALEPHDRTRGFCPEVMSTMHDTLDAAVHATHEVLAERLRKASAAFTTATGRRDVYRLTDTFLASTSMHLAAVNAVLLPAAKKHLPDGPAHVRAVVRQCQRLELALSQTKARLYGESHAIHRLWEDVWQHVGASSRRTSNSNARLWTI